MDIQRVRNADSGRVMRAVMCAFAVAFLIGGLLAPDLPEMLPGFRRIITSPAQLTRDYFHPELGSVSGAMLNTFLVAAFFCGMMFLPGAVVNGATVLGFFLTIGFGFFGINIMNILPTVLGVFVYSRIKHEPFSKNINFAMFSTGVAPLITHVLFYYPVMGDQPHLTPMSLVLALVIGVLFGCAIPPVCAHSMNFHKGYDLFNAGPAVGFLCFMFYSVMHRTFGVEAPEIISVLGDGNRAFVNTFCLTAFSMCLVCGLILNGGFKGYGELLIDPGYKSDFTAKFGPGLNLINMGVYGLCIVTYYNAIGAVFTGPTMGVMFGMVCCCCNGATPVNVFPIVLGYIIMGIMNHIGFTAYALNLQGLVVGLCFSSGLAPIAGVYGPLAGVVAGILHYCLVTSVPVIHGGFNLYNGGFTAGIVCFAYVPILEAFFKPRKRKA